MTSDTPSANIQTPMPMQVRLAPVIRAPDREEKNMQRQSMQARPNLGPGPGPGPGPDFTIYVNSSECRHSVELLRNIRDVHRVPCTVIDISNGANIPSWLKGTPSIVVGTDVYCGDTAFQIAESIFVNQHTASHPIGETSVLGASSFTDILSEKGRKSEQKGCGLSEAFSQPRHILEGEAEKKYSGSVDDAMAKLMQSRG